MDGIIITGIVTLLVGGTATYFIWEMMLAKKKQKMLADAEVQAEILKEKKMLQAKEKFIQLKSEHESYINERNLRISGTENKLKQKETIYLQRKEELQRSIKELENSEREIDSIRENLNIQLELVEQKEEEMQKLHKQQVQQLEALSGISAEEAKSQLIDSLKNEAKTEAMSFIQEIMDEAKMTANKEAKKIIVKSIQRVASETAIENSVTVFHIESDEIKGRIIGREGRNIRALEAATGVEIIVDDTPEAIVLSAFDPVRREIARLALHQLVTDGRIHPARIEEVVNKVKKQVEEEIIETGKRTTIDLGVHGLHPELIRLIGKMKYRSSYGQNLLQHSRETANLCAIMAAELGLNPKRAKRAGLLHDIGKVPDGFIFLGKIYYDKGSDSKLEYQTSKNAQDSINDQEFFSKSISILEQGREKFPNESELLKTLSASYVGANKFGTAIGVFKSLAESDPKKENFYNYGVVLMGADKYEESITQFNKAIELDPNFKNALYNLAVSYVKWGAGIKKEIDEKGDKSEAYKDKFRLAIPPLEKLTQMEPKELIYWDLLGKVYANTDNEAKAKDAFDREDKLRKGN